MCNQRGNSLNANKLSWKQLSLHERSNRWENSSFLLKLVASQITETRLT